MGDIADWMVEQALMDDFFERENWEDLVNEHVAELTPKELVIQAKDVLQGLPPDYPRLKQVETVRSIMIQWIGYQRMSDKQKYVLGNFILSNS